MRFMQTMINDMERIADIYFQISKLLERMKEAKSAWPEAATSEVERMMMAVQVAINNMLLNISMEPEDVDLDHAITLEDEIDRLREEYRNNHYTRLESGDYSPRAGVNYIDVLNRLERIGDHILNVNESSAGRRLKAMRTTGQN